MHVIGPRATINISKCTFTGRIVAVERTPFSAALEEDWLAPTIPSLHDLCRVINSACMCASYLVLREISSYRQRL